MKINNHPRVLIAAYAPSIAAERPPFFQHLAARLTRNTILAIDANCVPDTATLHQFPTLITFNDKYTFTLTADLRAAINDAKQAAAPR